MPAQLRVDRPNPADGDTTADLAGLAVSRPDGEVAHAAGRKAERRQRLLDASLELFAERGYANTPIELLCRTAGVSTKSFYREFADKEALFLDLYDVLMADAAAAVINVGELFPVEVGTIEELSLAHERIAAFVHAVADDPRVGRVLFLESVGISADLERHRRETHRLFADFILVSVGPLVARGTMPDRDYRRSAIALVGAINEVIVDHLHDSSDSVDELANDLADLFLAVRAGLIGS